MKDLFEETTIDWTTIKDYQEEGTLSGLCMALAESDKLLDYILKNQHYRGKNIYERIREAKSRFSDLNQLATALETKESIFEQYNKEVSKEDIRKAIKYYRQAILDLTESDKPDVGLGGKISSWFSYYFLFKPGVFKRLVFWFVFAVLLLFIFDITNPGQRLVHFFTNLVGAASGWLVTLGIFFGVLIIIVIGVIIYFEKRKK